MSTPLFADATTGPCLSPATEQALLAAALRVDAIRWAETQVGPDDARAHLNALLQPLLDTGRLPPDAATALALNSWLHRVFQQWGWLPDRATPHWQAMLFLYLHTYHLPTPRAYRHELARQWAALGPEAAETAAVEIRARLVGR